MPNSEVYSTIFLEMCAQGAFPSFSGQGSSLHIMPVPPPCVANALNSPPAKPAAVWYGLQMR